MKKILFFALFAAITVVHVYAEEASLTRSTTRLFMPIKPVQTPKIPTITVCWLDINDKIEEFEKILTPLTKFVEDDSVDAIILRINSGGGSPGDAQIISEYIAAAKLHKPILAFITGIGASAAYHIASSCTHIICPTSAQVGSIGAMIQYVFEKDKNYYYITSGSYKAPEVNLHQELDAGFIENEKARVQELATIFAQDVSKFRNIPLETILSWQAAIFPGATALQLGLVDQNGTMHDLLEKVVQLVSEKNSTLYERLAIMSSDGKVLKTYQL